jgi:arylsulfatase A
LRFRKMRLLTPPAVGALVWGLLLTTTAGARPLGEAASEGPPNIIYLFADDLGYGDLGSYGQGRIRTPRLDRLAAEGIRFTDHYSSSNVCAPSRASLMTGKHQGHAGVRNNFEVMPWGQYPLASGEVTIATLLKGAGYATAAIGKWGLGPVGSEGDPANHGFDLFFGYNCQRQAHTYYPSHLWRNERQIDLRPWNGEFPRNERGFLQAGAYEDIAGEPRDFFAGFKGEVYSPDLMIEEALRFIRDNRDGPFFLYYPTPVPHVALQVPDDSLMEYLALAWDDKPYLGDGLYLPHPAPRAAYAAMIARMDRDVGRIFDLIDKLGLAENTLIMFSSDNGALDDRLGVERAFFHNNGPLRDGKGAFYEGGIRVPMIARWKGRIAPGGVTDLPSAQYDVLPTLLALIGRSDLIPDDIDGISFAPTLLGRLDRQRRHEFLYWERPTGRGQQAVRMGDWKAIRHAVGDRPGPIELYNLAEDLGEEHDVADRYPEIVERMEEIMRDSRTPHPAFPMPMLGEDRR